MQVENPFIQSITLIVIEKSVFPEYTSYGLYAVN